MRATEPAPFKRFRPPIAEALNWGDGTVAPTASSVALGGIGVQDSRKGASSF